MTREKQKYFLGDDPNHTRPWKQLMNGVNLSHPEEKSQLPQQQHQRPQQHESELKSGKL
jgi:hypothetical protein